MDRLTPRRPPEYAAYPPRRWRGLAMALLALLVGVASAQAQMGGGRGGGGGRQNPPQQAPQPAPASPKAVPEPWPRLDVGATLCKSREGLVRYQAQIAAGSSVAAAVQAAECVVIRKQTAIKILDRDGPSRTQIVATDETQQTGWTNTYLPPTPPPTTAGK
jgi:hypothetical protein